MVGRRETLFALLIGLLGFISAAHASEPPELDSRAKRALYTRCVDRARPKSDLFRNIKELPDTVTRELIDGATISVAYNLSFAGRPAIMYNHGQGETIDDLERFFAFAARHRFNMISWDYPCYGKTPGLPSEDTLRATGIAVLKWLAAKAPDKPIVLWGQSLGAAVAFQIFKQNLAGDKIAIKAMVILSPWDNFKNTCVDNATIFFCTDSSIGANFYDNVAVARRLNVPVLFVTSDGDRKILKKRSLSVVNAVPGGFAQSIELDHGVDHEHLAAEPTLERVGAALEEKLSAH